MTGYLNKMKILPKISQKANQDAEDKSILKKIHLLDLLLRQFVVQKTSLSWMIPIQERLCITTTMM